MGAGVGRSNRPPRPDSSTCLLERVFDSLGVVCDHSQEDPRGVVQPCLAWFPVLQCRSLETEPRGKLRLARTEAPPAKIARERESRLALQVDRDYLVIEDGGNGYGDLAGARMPASSEVSRRLGVSDMTPVGGWG